MTRPAVGGVVAVAAFVGAVVAGWLGLPWLGGAVLVVGCFTAAFIAE